MGHTGTQVSDMRPDARAEMSTAGTTVKILLLTSTARRHLRFASCLSRAFHWADLHVVVEARSPSPWPLAYDRRVWDAEQRVFDEPARIEGWVESVATAQDAFPIGEPLIADTVLLLGPGLTGDPRWPRASSAAPSTSTRASPHSI